MKRKFFFGRKCFISSKCSFLASVFKQIFTNTIFSSRRLRLLPFVTFKKVTNGLDVLLHNGLRPQFRVVHVLCCKAKFQSLTNRQFFLQVRGEVGGWVCFIDIVSANDCSEPMNDGLFTLDIAISGCMLHSLLCSHKQQSFYLIKTWKKSILVNNLVWRYFPTNLISWCTLNLF